VLKDPRIGATQEDLDAQYQLGLKIRDAISRMNDGILAIRDVREQLEGWQKRLGRREDADEAKKSAADLIKRLTAIEEELVDTRSTSGTGYPPPNVPTRLTQKLATLAAYVGSADAAPTRQESDVYELLADQLEQQLQALSDLMSTDIPAFDAALRRLQMPAVIPRSQAATVKAASD
jgi:DNA repair exonuclease SbcCD ATPase subunit